MDWRDERRKVKHVSVELRNRAALRLWRAWLCPEKQSRGW